MKRCVNVVPVKSIMERYNVEHLAWNVNRGYSDIARFVWRTDDERSLLASVKEGFDWISCATFL